MNKINKQRLLQARGLLKKEWRNAFTPGKYDADNGRLYSNDGQFALLRLPEDSGVSVCRMKQETTLWDDIEKLKEDGHLNY